ncbi:mitochondrial ribosomal protein subunit L20-domain-containing protein [Ilyonectria robusta]|uniref:mitochondrial ribosomal protein subunit L20-domain-containing protein n=1 Tax=Ilyonectria robusta TaxID=1079257 RepID=UPI001E8EB934|nr:mitochondrial ribosomal protein subunit L20-domain-containing protein [Ilyonectria robusta]KAH8672992.1 mitochondrial ribosomal protein subunit L20-domain-containing protein [Ilyonectria robusta]
MEFRALARPAARLLNTTRATTLPLIPVRGHKTTARTKRSLKIAAHDSFLPNRQTAFPAEDSIIYNPPSSEASPEHTPFLFLPSNDARRAAFTRLRHIADSPAAPKKVSELPKEVQYKRRTPSYHLGAEEIKEMKRLRNEDPFKWTSYALAEKFQCSSVFVRMAAPAPAEYLKALKDKSERREGRWGHIRTKAREDRKRRTDMLYRGEL